VKQAVFGPLARFRLLDEAVESGDFEIERRAGNGIIVARSLDDGEPRTFNQLDLRRALAERRLHFHLEGRHVAPAREGVNPLAPREPDFSALPVKERDLARRRYETIRPLLEAPRRRSALVRDRADAHGVSERTVWSWLRWYRGAGDIRALLPRVGPRRRGWPTRSAELLEIIAERLEARWLQRTPWPLTDAALEVIAEVERRNGDGPASERITLARSPAGQVSLAAVARMVQRQASCIPADKRIAAQQGQVAARSQWDTNVGELRVAQLLDRVDYDAVRLPIVVVDEEHRLVIGRPWLIFGIEHKSGMPHGYFLSWEPPNYRSVMECLLFSILPKDELNARFGSLRGVWECEGMPRAIAIDNGPEFANRHLDDAARQVDFDVLPCPVRVPWFKGIVEGFFARLNRQLLRSLPGTTLANIVERGDYDPAQHACLSMAALEEILVLFCVDQYPQRFNRHLRGRPIDLWRNNPIVRDGLLPYPPSAEDLRVLMGWTDQRLVTRRGVQCDDLRALRGDTVLVKIDPRDLGCVWVLDPRPGHRRYLAVPAANREYASGVSLWQHRVVCRMANIEAARDNIALLVETKAKIQAIVERERTATRRTRSRQVLARWLDQQPGPSALASAKRAGQALKSASQPGLPSRPRAVPSTPPRGLTPATGAIRTAVEPVTPTLQDLHPALRRRLLTGRAAFEVSYAQEEVDAAAER
jgi:putative transposase